MNLQSIEKVYVENVKALIKKNKLKEALNKLDKLTKIVGDEDFETGIIMQMASYNGAVNDSLTGVMSQPFYQQTMARIKVALLHYINNIPDAKLLKASSQIVSSNNISLSTDFTELEKVIGNEELFEINWLEKAIKASRSVCKVDLGGNSGTGFVLRGGYLLTNHHVLEDKGVASRAKAIFNYQKSINGQTELTTEYDLDTSVFYTSEFGEYDYTLVKIKDESGDLEQRGFLRLGSSANTSVDDKINIIQHPEGGTMKIALPDEVISKWNQHLYYVADTKPGSSGSPVFNQNWEVIALHHAGADRFHSRGGLQINEAGEIRESNRGVLIEKIVEDLRDKGFSFD